MFTAGVRRDPDGFVLDLEGDISELVKFPDLPELMQGTLRVFCGKIRRMNSAGIRAWIRFFSRLRREGVQLKFQNCSAEFVHHLNVVQGICRKGEVVSIQLPLFCPACRREWRLVQDRASFASGCSPRGLSALHCPGCHTALLFDDIEEEYYSFLRYA